MQNNYKYELELCNASRGKRFLNYLIDSTCVCLAAMFIGGIIGLWNPDMLDGVEENSISIQLLGALIYLVYYMLFEGLIGNTVGKLITGTCLFTENGRTPSFKKVTVRTLCRLIPFDWLSIFGSGERCWHDTIPGVYVVNKKRFEILLQEESSG